MIDIAASENRVANVIIGKLPRRQTAATHDIRVSDYSFRVVVV
jgi:hypothetical protein